MAKYCPFGECQLCSSDCALRVGEECAITDIALYLRDKKCKEILNSIYGTQQMKYNNNILKEVSKMKEKKTPEIMFSEGWCKDCDYSYLKCMKKGVCKGYIEEKEDDHDNTGEETTV